MARHILTDREIRNAKPRDKAYRLHDGDGLALRVAPSGAHSWQLKYRLNGKEQLATLGRYTPVQGLAWARAVADDKRAIVAEGKHLTTAKRVARAERVEADAQTFGTLAAAWSKLEARRQGWSPEYVTQVAQCLRNHLSELDPLPVTAIRASIVAPILHRIEIEAPGMEPRASRRLHAIMDYAVETGALELNPLPRRKRGKGTLQHFPAVVDLPGIGAILRAARDRPARSQSVNRAHILLAFTAQRIENVTSAHWSEFDLDAGAWAIPRERMKRKDADRGPHLVPLPPRLLASLREWRAADGERAVFVCPTKNKRKPIVRDMVTRWYRDKLKLAGKHSAHSWRSAFSTLCREAGKPGDVVEAQLDHVVGNSTASVYDRAQRIEQRRTLLDWYESTLIAARDGAAVVPFAKRR